MHNSAGMDAPRFNAITRCDLEDNDRLTELLRQALALGSWRSSGDSDILNFFSLAEKALSDDSRATPGKLFRHLVENRKTDTVTNLCEKRALRRLGFDGIYRIRESLAKPRFDTGAPPVRFGYCPSQLVRCPFPQRRLDRNARHWQIPARHGTVTVSAGHFSAPGVRADDFEVPHSGTPRLLLPYIVGEALRNGRTVRLGKNLHQLLKTLGISRGSKNYRMISTQLLHLGACQITTVTSRIDRSHQKTDISLYNVSENISYRRPITTFEHAEASRSRQEDPISWETTFTLSEQFYEYVRANPVPVNLADLARLVRSPRRMDLYTWLSNRVYHMHDRPVSIPLTQLHRQFAPDINPAHDRLFRHRFRQDVEAVCGVHPGFRVSLSQSHMTINHRSTPPIRPRQ